MKGPSGQLFFILVKSRRRRLPLGSERACARSCLPVRLCCVCCKKLVIDSLMSVITGKKVRRFQPPTSNAHTSCQTTPEQSLFLNVPPATSRRHANDIKHPPKKEGIKAKLCMQPREQTWFRHFLHFVARRRLDLSRQFSTDEHLARPPWKCVSNDGGVTRQYVLLR